MSNSYVLGIAVGIAFGIMLVAFIFSYLTLFDYFYIILIMLILNQIRRVIWILK